MTSRNNFTSLLFTSLLDETDASLYVLFTIYPRVRLRASPGADDVRLAGIGLFLWNQEPVFFVQ